LLSNSIAFLFLTLPINGYYFVYSGGKASINFYRISLKVTNSPTLIKNSLGFCSKVYGKYFIESLKSLLIGIGTLSILNGSKEIDILLQTVHCTLDFN
jgi:hypothetical protein